MDVPLTILVLVALPLSFLSAYVAASAVLRRLSKVVIAPRHLLVFAIIFLLVFLIVISLAIFAIAVGFNLGR